MSNRNGFTLIEILIVAVLGMVLMGSVYQVLITNQRVYAVQQEQIQGHQTVRTGVDVLFSELREISPRGDDILGMDSDTLAVRVMRSFGHVCHIDALTRRLTVRTYGRQFSASDSMFVFADWNPDISSDDTWIAGSPTGVASGACPSPPYPVSADDQYVFIPDATDVAGINPITLGAPVRQYTRFTYGLFEIGGAWYLGRRAPGAAPQELVGPVRRDGGVVFEYRNALGNVTLDPRAVTQVRVTIATASAARGSGGQPVADELVSTIYLRN